MQSAGSVRPVFDLEYSRHQPSTRKQIEVRHAQSSFLAALCSQLSPQGCYEKLFRVSGSSLTRFPVAA